MKGSNALILLRSGCDAGVRFLQDLPQAGRSEFVGGIGANRMDGQVGAALLLGIGETQRGEAADKPVEQASGGEGEGNAGKRTQDLTHDADTAKSAKRLEPENAGGNPTP